MSDTHPGTNLEAAIQLLRRYNLNGQSASLDADVVAFLRRTYTGPVLPFNGEHYGPNRGYGPVGLVAREPIGYNEDGSIRYTDQL